MPSYHCTGTNRAVLLGHLYSWSSIKDPCAWICFASWKLPQKYLEHHGFYCSCYWVRSCSYSICRYSQLQNLNQFWWYFIIRITIILTNTIQNKNFFSEKLYRWRIGNVKRSPRNQHITHFIILCSWLKKI